MLFTKKTPQPAPDLEEKETPLATNPMPQAPAFSGPASIPQAPMLASKKEPVFEKPSDTPQSLQMPEDEHIEVTNTQPHEEIDANGRKVFKAISICDVDFSDIWLTPEKVSYIRDKSTKFALIPFETEDMEEFSRALAQGFQGSSSYAIRFKNEAYRVERVTTTTGVQFNCRKMPTSTPSIYNLGLPEPVVKYMTTLATESGLILFAGPTGMGKTTSASALLREFLETHGGFMYTIEDPPEMPLDGLYHAKNGGLGLCKQSPVENERWEDGLKSALRSRPRYILVGEIRTPEVASQALRAATSGHLVLSTIHANSVEDALNSMIKYASGAGLDEKLVCDLLARGILGVIHQQLEGTTVLRPVIHTAFANPNPLVACQMRMSIREGKIALATFMEAQNTRMFQGRPLFREIK
ncbi:MAG: Flp pilus assembly complex ATPase component TadA [Alphaproteobacteria bacterium]|nr:Flp pilus assembly complex ATPase component TadA [Alphaproteobacteria bacterium]